ncbi:glycosyltransferase family 4 protein [Yersinia pekkanenii]|uniref:Glycosyl transferase n=1 Tax=Yersinia pekkanenii TaxID=1288385 RepID=A0A0T9NJ85_9GAMM|nr:glycosyltransferase family 4 protein [Yersinia pekkanenii]CNH13133.1 putative glycosyl transferase [Yersinia pekkanenii]CRY65438.1 putative glycosyl transferase [Yersinia pekkanenii]
MNTYDFVFITNVPAFYKVNLFNRLAKYCRVKVIFISNKSKIRNSDFYNYTHEFDSEYIHVGNFEDRNNLQTLIKIYNTLKNINFIKLVYPGWEIKELLLLSFLSNKKKNSVVIESSINETKTTGYAWLLKKLFLKRMSSAYPSGFLQKKILEKIKFHGQITLTHGVGIPNYIRRPFKGLHEKKDEGILTYLYVGRLSKEKNLSFLVDTFNKRLEKLIIVGSGPEAIELESKSKNNITFLGYVNNINLNEIYKSADVFILPSKSEPWGLVIEEALTFGLPIIVSNKVGCKDDLITNGNGLIFDVDDTDSFECCLNEMNTNYKKYFDQVNAIDMHSIYERQVKSYLISLKS